MIKVCSPQLGISPKSILGGEVHDYQLINQLCRKGVRFNILLPKGREYAAHSNLIVEYLPFQHIVPPALFNLISLPFLFTTYSRERFNILRIHSPYFLGFAARIFKYFHPEVKVVTTIHLQENRIDLDWILRRTIGVYDHIFVVSGYLKRCVANSYNISPEKITVIYNGVSDEIKPVPKDKELIKSLGLENKVVLLNLGQLIKRKNVLFLLDVFKSLSKRYTNIVLLFCGTGDLKGKLADLILARGLENNVKILDPVFGKDKNIVFNLADIFLFPSGNEGFGLVAAEAMACQKPVIASNNTSLPEVVINRESGLLANTNDLNDWVEKIGDLIDNKKLRLRMGKFGEKRARELFNWEKVAESTQTVYRNLTK